MCCSSPRTTSSPSKPALRAACAARIPASEAPTMTRPPAMGSALQPDRQHRAHVHGLLELCALGLVDLVLPLEDVVVAELEHVGRREDALAVALAEVHVDVDLDRAHAVVLPWVARRSASSSGMASATCSVLGEIWSCSPGPVRSTSQSTTVFVRRPRPSISTSTTSPGSIGRLLAGVPVSTTSPGSSVMTRDRSASW